MTSEHEDSATTIDRQCARIILLDDADRILLFRVESRVLGREVWITPGGGLDEGESFEDGARRELWEETGLRAEIGPWVWFRTFEFVFDGDRYRQSERFCVVRCAPFEISRANWTEEERDDLMESRWWGMDEIADSDETFFPLRMPELLPAIVAGELPREAIDCGG